MTVNRINLQHTGLVTRLDGTDELFSLIAYYNGAMTPDEVRTALEQYEPVYTAFSKYERERF